MSINIDRLLPPFSQEALGLSENKRQAEITWISLHNWLHSILRDRITVSPELEKLGFIGGINRTNTGALTTAIGRAPTEQPITRHIQPIKAIARRLVLEQLELAPSTPLTFLKNELELGSGVQLVKETIGPDVNNPGEWMESMQLLLEAGVPPEKMFFIPTFRDPLDVVASWKRMWGWEISSFPFESFNFSFQKVEQMVQEAKERNILVTPYIHEFLRDFGSAKTLARILNIVGLPFNENIINWGDDDDPYWQGNIVKYDVPPNAWIQGSLSPKHGGRGGLEWKPIKSEHKLTLAEEIIVKQKIKTALDVYKRMEILAGQILAK